MDEILEDYATNHPNTLQSIIVLYDAGQPYSYEQWGDHGVENLPYIISDSENIINSEWFEFSDFPLNIIIDQNMEIFQIIEGDLEPEELEFYFDQLNN